MVEVGTSTSLQHGLNLILCLEHTPGRQLNHCIGHIHGVVTAIGLDLRACVCRGAGVCLSAGAMRGQVGACSSQNVMCTAVHVGGAHTRVCVCVQARAGVGSWSCSHLQSQSHTYTHRHIHTHTHIRTRGNSLQPVASSTLTFCSIFSRSDVRSVSMAERVSSGRALSHAEHT